MKKVFRWLGMVSLICVLFTVTSVFAEDAKPADAPVPAADVKAGDTLDQFDPMVDKLLAAYNAGDSKAFYADYASTMAAIATDQAFQTLYKDNYMANLGKYVSRKIKKEESVVVKDTPVGLLVYSGEFEKEKKVKISVNLIKEGDVYKVMQVQFAKE